GHARLVPRPRGAADGVRRVRRQVEVRRVPTLARPPQRGGHPAGVRRPRRRWERPDAAHQDVLVAVLRHGHRPLRPGLDGHGPPGPRELTGRGMTFTRISKRGFFMKVMVIVKATRASEAGELPSTELLAAMGKYNEELARAGILLAGEGLQPSSKGARVRFSGKSRVVTDGPFAETKELIAGFWMWKVSPNPRAEDSDIEVRPAFEAEDFGESFTPQLREQEAAVRAQALGLPAPAFRQGPDLLVAGLNESYGKGTRTQIPQQWQRLAS